MEKKTKKVTKKIVKKVKEPIKLVVRHLNVDEKINWGDSQPR